MIRSSRMQFSRFSFSWYVRAFFFNYRARGIKKSFVRRSCKRYFKRIKEVA